MCLPGRQAPFRILGGNYVTSVWQPPPPPIPSGPGKEAAGAAAHVLNKNKCPTNVHVEGALVPGTAAPVTTQ